MQVLRSAEGCSAYRIKRGNVSRETLRVLSVYCCWIKANLVELILGMWKYRIFADNPSRAHRIGFQPGKSAQFNSRLSTGVSETLFQ